MPHKRLNRIAWMSLKRAEYTEFRTSTNNNNKINWCVRMFAVTIDTTQLQKANGKQHTPGPPHRDEWKEKIFSYGYEQRTKEETKEWNERWFHRKWFLSLWSTVIPFVRNHSRLHCTHTRQFHISPFLRMLCDIHQTSEQVVNRYQTQRTLLRAGEKKRVAQSSLYKIKQLYQFCSL